MKRSKKPNGAKGSNQDIDMMKRTKQDVNTFQDDAAPYIYVTGKRRDGFLECTTWWCFDGSGERFHCCSGTVVATGLWCPSYWSGNRQSHHLLKHMALSVNQPPEIQKEANE